MKTKMEERMLVTVTLNLMHRLEDFQAFKEKRKILVATIMLKYFILFDIFMYLIKQ